MSCAVATQADTSSNQASKDPGHCVVAIVTSVKFYRNLAAGRVAATCGYAPCQKKKWPCAQPTNASEATHFRLFNFRLSLPLFLISQIVLQSLAKSVSSLPPEKNCEHRPPQPC
jgi:hypothetical protein